MSMANGRNKSTRGTAVLDGTARRPWQTPKVSRAPSKAELEAKVATITKLSGARLRMRQRDDPRMPSTRLRT